MKYLTKGLSKVALVIFCWFALFEINSYVFDFIEIDEAVSWIFLPAFIRLVAVLIFGFWGVLGLFLGALITSPSIEFATIPIAFTSAISPLIAIVLIKYICNIKKTVEIVSSVKNLLFLVLAMAFVSSTLHTLMYEFIGSNTAICPMVIGDLIGSLLMMYLIRYSMLLSDNINTKISS